VIDFLRNRSERQQDAKNRIAEALNEYNVGAVDTLIGDISPPDALMKTLTDRKQAEQEKVTYATQRLAEETRKELEQARATADTQAGVVSAERSVEIAQFASRAAVKKAEGESQSRLVNAEADAKGRVVTAEAEAKQIQLEGSARAGATNAIGTAEAAVIRLKIESMQSGNYAAIEVARALANGNLKLVPEILVNGGGSEGSPLGTALLATMLTGRTKTDGGNGLVLDKQ